MKISRARGARRRRLIAESLESRRVMAAALDGGLLTIDGTNEPDRIFVRQLDDQLVVNIRGEES
jgi:hypothetical protein